MTNLDSKDLLRTAEQVWNMLDKLSEENPDQYKKFIDEQLNEGATYLRPPEPAYGLTCTTAYRGRDCSLFINVCKWAKVPHPLTDADPVPVKGGTLRYEVLDGRKTVNFVYDIAFNPQVVEECSSNPVLFDMLTSLSLDFIEDMTKLNVRRDTLSKSDIKGTQTDVHYSLDEGLKHLLPKESQLDFGDSLLDELGRLSSSSGETGELPPLKLPHQEKNSSQKPLIEELSTTANNSEVITKRPHYTVDVVSIGEKKGLEIKVKLPGVKSVNDVNLEISEIDLQLSVERLYHLNVSFPERIEEDTVKAKYISSKYELLVTVQFL